MHRVWGPRPERRLQRLYARKGLAPARPSSILPVARKAINAIGSGRRPGCATCGFVVFGGTGREARTRLSKTKQLLPARVSRLDYRPGPHGEYRRKLEPIRADLEKLAFAVPRKDKVGAITRDIDGCLKDLS